MTTKTYKFQELSAEQLAWLAGLFQAEAYFHFDNRVRATTPDYIPPPPAPQIKLEMVEEDLMSKVGEYLECNVITVKRKTTAGKTVYKITLYARDKVEAFLVAIQPYVVGNKTRSKIAAILDNCEQYKAWVAAGGKSQAAKIANKASQEVKKNKNK